MQTPSGLHVLAFLLVNTTWMPTRCAKPAPVCPQGNTTSLE